MYKAIALSVGAFLLLAFSIFGLQNPTCLWVSSYAPGYAWNDAIEKGIRESLGSQCELSVFYMDTKQNKNPEFAQRQAIKASRIITVTAPDVVIATDDNASKYLVVPYLKNSKTPVVVSGINWSGEKYGYPYKNLTAMVEVLPLDRLLYMIKSVSGKSNPVITILAGQSPADIPMITNKKNVYDFNQEALNNAGIS